MSFILEALKKSEQQRQQKNTPPQEVRQRTLFLPAHRSVLPRYYWLAAGFLPLFLFSGWWLYSGREEPNPVVFPTENKAQPGPSSSAQPKQPEPASGPHDFVATPPLAENFPPAAPTATVANSHEPAAKPLRLESPTPRERLKPAEPLATVVRDQPEVRLGDNIPLYLELPRELRDRMPRLTMSMHFHSPDPGRRLVRINDRLLREGDWLSGELQIVEITQTGAILDFLGKIFAMHSPSR